MICPICFSAGSVGITKRPGANQLVAKSSLRRGKRVQEDINNFWMGHAPETMSETYSRLDLELDLVLRKRRPWASVSPFRLFQLLQVAQVAPRFRKNRMSNWFPNFSRIN